MPTAVAPRAIVALVNVRLLTLISLFGFSFVSPPSSSPSPSPFLFFLSPLPQVELHARDSCGHMTI
jgi:hypothetical protein